MEHKDSNNKIELPELGDIHESEHRLLLAIRHKYQFAEIKILTRHGLPYRLKLSERFVDLNSDTFTGESLSV